MSIKREFTLNITWGIEKYSYSLDFSLERVGYMISNMFLDDKLLTVPKKLYKYYRPTAKNLDAFSNGYLYFASPAQLNDPFDCLYNRDEFLRNSGPGFAEHRDNIGVCCFSLSNEIQLMWSHYANSYNGFCLGFANPHLIGQKYITFQTHASYLENYEPSNPNLKEAFFGVRNSNIKPEFKDAIEKLLTLRFEYCWKTSQWSYEQEYRAVSIYSNQFNRKVKFDRTKLKSLYIGYQLQNTNPEYYNSLIEIVRKKYRNIDVIEVRPDPLSPKLKFVEIEI